MSSNNEDFVIPAGAFRLQAARLHGRYIHRQVMVPDPGGELRVIGNIESIKLRNPSGEGYAPEKYWVTLVVSGYKMKVPGHTEITFLDGAGEPAP